MLFVVFGILMLLAAIGNWEWVFSGNSYNTQKLEGISNM
ncbi:MAG: immunity 17 family protein, partial [Flavobacteriaceae bacterium]|nr:immunity 17 family protein [Flavobacteriaceae bacterium]